MEIMTSDAGKDVVHYLPLSNVLLISEILQDKTPTGEMVAAVRDAAPKATLKVILETGAFGDDLGGIARIGAAVIAAGADMLKTSTGKSAQGASLPAARALLEVIRTAERPVGFKASGGIRTASEAAAYLALAEDIMGDGWAMPVRFRIGASRLLDELLGLLAGN